MSRLILNEQASVPAAPAASKLAIFADTTSTPRIRAIDDAGTTFTLLDSNHNSWLLTNGSTAAVSAGYASDTYLAGSSIVIPAAGLWKAGTCYYCVFDMTKTGAGTGQASLNLRIGTAGTTSDSAVCTQTYTAGTANADTGIWECWANFRSVGSGTSAVVQLVTRVTKNLTTTGLINSTNINLYTLTTSSGFNSTTSTTIGLSFNGNTSFSGTNTIVQAQLFGLSV
jgi:hypothetical protein